MVLNFASDEGIGLFGLDPSKYDRQEKQYEDRCHELCTGLTICSTEINSGPDFSKVPEQALPIIYAYQITSWSGKEPADWTHMRTNLAVHQGWKQAGMAVTCFLDVMACREAKAGLIDVCVYLNPTPLVQL